MARYHSRRGRSAHQTIAAQVDNLASKTMVHGLCALVSFGLATHFCSTAPDRALCSVFEEVANKQAEEFGTSLLSSVVFSFLV